MVTTWLSPLHINRLTPVLGQVTNEGEGLAAVGRARQKEGKVKAAMSRLLPFHTWALVWLC